MKEIDLFIKRIEEQEDLLFGTSLFYQGILQMYSADEYIMKMNRESYESILKRGNKAIEIAKHLLDKVQKDTSKLYLLQEFEFPPTIEEISIRSKILIEAYDELFPGRPREKPLTEKENMQLIEIASNRL